MQVSKAAYVPFFCCLLISAQANREDTLQNDERYINYVSRMKEINDGGPYSAVESWSHLCQMANAQSALLDTFRDESEACDLCAAKHKKFMDFRQEVMTQRNLEKGVRESVGAQGGNMSDMICVNPLQPANRDGTHRPMIDTSLDRTRAQKAADAEIKKQAYLQRDKELQQRLREHPPEIAAGAELVLAFSDDQKYSDLKIGETYNVQTTQAVYDNYQNVAMGINTPAVVKLTELKGKEATFVLQSVSIHKQSLHSSSDATSMSLVTSNSDQRTHYATNAQPATAPTSRNVRVPIPRGRYGSWIPSSVSIPSRTSQGQGGNSEPQASSNEVAI